MVVKLNAIPARVEDSVRMTVDEWIMVRDHPHQRDTEKHAKVAVKGHLKEYCQPHRFVDAVRYKGKTWKLNGHTRAYLWALGQLGRPRDGMVVVNIIDAETEEEFLAYYDMYDNKDTEKTHGDTLYSACKSAGLSLKSTLLASEGSKGYRWSTQLVRAARIRKPLRLVDMYKLVVDWSEEIEALDGLMFPRKHPYLVGMMLTAMRLHGADDKMVSFFRGVFDHAGVKRDKSRDGVQAAVEFIDERKAIDATAGWPNWDRIDAFVWNAYMKYRFNKLLALRTKLKADTVYADLNVERPNAGH